MYHVPIAAKLDTTNSPAVKLARCVDISHIISIWLLWIVRRFPAVSRKIAHWPIPSCTDCNIITVDTFPHALYTYCKLSFVTFNQIWKCVLSLHYQSSCDKAVHKSVQKKKSVHIKVFLELSPHTVNPNKFKYYNVATLHRNWCTILWRKLLQGRSSMNIK